MFKRFNTSEDIGPKVQLKQSQAKSIKKQIITQYPEFENYIKDIVK